MWLEGNWPDSLIDKALGAHIDVSLQCLCANKHPEDASGDI